MKLCLRQKTVLDEREMQEMYRIEHRGLWAMYTLLCAAVVVQLFFGAGFAQIAGEVCVISLVSVAMIVACAPRHLGYTGQAQHKGQCGVFCAVCPGGIRRGARHSRRRGCGGCHGHMHICALL